MLLLGHLLRHGPLRRDELGHGHRVHVRYGDSFSGQNHPLEQQQQQRENDGTRGPKQNSPLPPTEPSLLTHSHTHAHQTTAYLDLDPKLRGKKRVSEKLPWKIVQSLSQSDRAGKVS